MNRLRIHSWLAFALLALAVAGVELWYWQRVRARAVHALGRLELVAQERDHLVRLSPAPSEENEKHLARAVAAQHARIADLRAALRPGAPSPLVGAVPGQPVEAFFSLAALVDWARARASAGRVVLRPDERFGFSAYANEGPPVALIDTVRRQQVAVQTVLAPLFEARPLALLGVRRESPAPGAVAGDDFFAIEPALSLRQPGLVDTEPLKLEFTGQTATLRDLLNGLSVLRDPVVVRSVDVEPLRVPEHAAPVPTAVVGDSPELVVRRSLSKFVVTVEFIVLPAPPVPPAS